MWHWIHESSSCKISIPEICVDLHETPRNDRPRIKPDGSLKAKRNNYIVNVSSFN